MARLRRTVTLSHRTPPVQDAPKPTPRPAA